MLGRKILITWLGLALGFPYYGTGLHAQTKSSSTSDGVYTASQAQQSLPIYHQQCASCHGEDLEGSGQTPPLVGDDFIQNWQGLTLDALFDKIQVQMPADHPGTLSREQAAGILAYILSANKYPVGKTELPTDAAALKQIHIDKPPAAAPKN